MKPGHEFYCIVKVGVTLTCFQSGCIDSVACGGNLDELLLARSHFGTGHSPYGEVVEDF